MKIIKSMLIFTIFLLTSYTAVNAESVYEKTFEESLGEWTQTVGTTEFKRTNNQMSISNTTQGSSIESIAILNDSPIFKDGEVEMNFLYEGQKNFSLIFRADLSDKSKWQTVAYNTEGKWTVGQPGGKWLTNIAGPTLVNGKTYRLLICYEGKKLEVFLNDELFYKNDEVVYPNSTTIDSKWEGKLGVRLFGDRSTLKINSLKSGPIESIRVNEENLKQFELMRDRWKSNLVGNFGTQPELQNDEQVKGYISQLSNNSKELLTSMNQSIGRTDLWEKISSDTASANLTTQFKKINILAKAYGTKGTDLYQNKELLDAIVSSLDFLTSDGRYSGEKYFGNWWDWQIGVPQEFVSTLMILYDDIDDANMERYVSIMSKYLPNPYQQMYGKAQSPSIDLSFIPNFKNSGANRTDHALSVLGIGLLSNNSFKITEAVDSIEEIFKTVTSGDGFYADGSFIQHTYIPYTGAYGNVLIKGVGKIYAVVSDTKWESNESSRTDFVNKVTDSFIPIIVNGETMSFVNGRSISRAPTSTQNGFGSTTLYNLLITAEFADETNKTLLRQTAKYWMTQNVDYYLDNTRDFKDLLLTKSVLSDTSIDTTTKPFLGSHVYGAMDRYVYSNSDISLGISMHSKRISAYEAINKENKKGWHTSDGMLYLYNNDGQFGSSYWPTVDWYRLPGTTVDTRPLVDELSFKEFRSIEDYVGGVYNNEDAVVSMQLNKAGTYNGASLTDMNLKAKKSWFVFDGKIISLGSDISGTSDSSIETIIDNRMLDSSSQYQMLNQKGEDVSNSDLQNKKSTDWLLLKSSTNNQSIGYLMLGNQSVTTKKEIRKGTYQQINNAFPSDLEYEETYQKIMVNHGNDINDGTYAYVTYPNADENKLNKLQTSNRYSVMENSKDIQAVKDNVDNKVGITFWNEAGGSIGGVSSNKSSSVLYSELEDEFEISISNPKQTSEVIEVELPHEVKNVVSKDESIQLVNDTTIQVDTSGALGKTFHFKANYEKEEDEIEVESIKISNNSLEILKKGRTLNLNAKIQPENATNQSIKWESMNIEVAEIQGNKLIGKNPGITKVKALSENGKEDTFTIRVTR